MLGCNGFVLKLIGASAILMGLLCLVGCLASDGLRLGLLCLLFLSCAIFLSGQLSLLDKLANKPAKPFHSKKCNPVLQRRPGGLLTVWNLFRSVLCVVLKSEPSLMLDCWIIFSSARRGRALFKRMSCGSAFLSPRPSPQIISVA